DAGRYQTLSSALAVLALDAQAALAPPASAAGITLAALNSSGVAGPLATEGVQLVRAPVREEATGVRAESPRGMPLYAQLVETGYDRSPPAQTVSQGVEVVRELRDAQGSAASRVSLGQKLDVVVRVRAVDRQAHEVALVDLLPGGFEVDLTSSDLAE